MEEYLSLAALGRKVTYMAAKINSDIHKVIDISDHVIVWYVCI